MPRAHSVLFCLMSLLLAACAAPTATSELLPTRAATPTPTPNAVSAQAYYEEGLARQEAGDADGALQSFTWAIEVMPDFAPAYVARGTVYLAQGRIDLALDDANAALEADPGYLGYLADLGGGKVLEEPKGAFAHTIRGRATSRDLWPYLLGLATLLLPLDIGVRRLALGRRDLVRAWEAVRSHLPPGRRRPAARRACILAVA